MSLTYRYLSIPFRNPFDNERLSFEDFVQFSTEVRGRLQATGARLGISQVQMDNYNAALDNFSQYMGDENIASANKKGASYGLKNTWASIVEEVRRKEAWVRSKYDKNSPVYVTIYPQGLAPYQQTKRGEMSNLLFSLKSTFALYATDFPGAADTFASLYTTFVDASSEQTGKKGQLGDSKLARRVARKALAGNLHEIWLTMAIHNMGQPEVVKTIFNVSIFNKGKNRDNDKLGRLVLLVLDEAGQPVREAKVEVRNMENQIVQKGKTKPDGRYKGRLLDIGFYDITVKQVGKQTHQARFQVFDNEDPMHELVMKSVEAAG